MIWSRLKTLSVVVVVALTFLTCTTCTSDVAGTRTRNVYSPPPASMLGILSQATAGSTPSPGLFNGRNAVGGVEQEAAVPALHLVNQEGVAALNRGDPATAKKIFLFASRLSPGNPTVLFNLAVAAKELSLLGDAVSILEKSIAASQARGEAPLPQALFNLARTHQLRADDGTSQGFYHNATARHNTLLQSKFLFMDLLSRNSLEEAAPDVEALRCLEEVLYQLGENTSVVASALFAVNPGAGIVVPARRLSDTCSSIAEWLRDLRGGLWSFLVRNKKYRLPWLAGALDELGAVPLVSDGGESLCTMSSYLPSVQNPKARSSNKACVSNSHGDVTFEEASALFAAHGFAPLPKGVLSTQLHAYATTMFRVLHATGMMYRSDPAYGGVAGHAFPRNQTMSGDGKPAGAKRRAGLDNRGEVTAILAQSRRALDNPRLLRFIAELVKPTIEQVVGQSLRATFSKLVVYDGDEPGTALPPHRDQILCDISVSLVLNSTAKGAGSHHWPLVLEGPPKSLDLNGTAGKGRGWQGRNDVHFLAPNGSGTGFLFRGRDFLHWRSTLPRGEESMVALLHYVRATSPLPQSIGFENVSAKADSQPPTHVVDIPEVTCVSRVDPSANASSIVSSQCEKRSQQETADKAKHRNRRFLLYSPCVEIPRTGSGPKEGHQSGFENQFAMDNAGPVCAQQFSNQVFSFFHALSAAHTIGRTLVLPPIMQLSAAGDALSPNKSGWWEGPSATEEPGVPNQMHGTRQLEPPPEQQWFPFEDIFNVSKLQARGYDVISLEHFVNLTGGCIPFFYYPPYIVHEDDTRAYAGRWFRYFGIQWLNPRRMSAVEEVLQATSGIGASFHSLRHAVQARRQEGGDENWQPRDGQRYWKAFEVLLAAHERAHGALVAKHFGPNASLGSEEYSDAQVALVNQQALELVEWSSLLLQSPSVAVDDIEGAPRNLGPAAGTSRCIVPASAQLHNRCCNATKERVSGAAEFDSAESIFDTLAFDYAPSFGYYMDGFAFDTELRGVMRATMFNSEIVDLARALSKLLFGERRYIGAHLRRNGYDKFCFGRGLEYYAGRRFGREVTPGMCFPSLAQVGGSFF
eukprot:INCI14723.2.p1 GENE.INCI14723.2~~INCI14723.2.p1  ORF type:complete len:1089 (-),score=149.70 INCI14723.2:677-3943(-)